MYNYDMLPLNVILVASEAGFGSIPMISGAKFGIRSELALRHVSNLIIEGFSIDRRSSEPKSLSFFPQKKYFCLSYLLLRSRLMNDESDRGAPPLSPVIKVGN